MRLGLGCRAWLHAPPRRGRCCAAAPDAEALPLLCLADEIEMFRRMQDALGWRDEQLNFTCIGYDDM